MDGGAKPGPEILDGNRGAPSEGMRAVRGLMLGAGLGVVLRLLARR